MPWSKRSDGDETEVLFEERYKDRELVNKVEIEGT